MTILFTSNTDGGMLHFVVQLLLIHTQLQKEALLFLPRESTVTIPEGMENRFVFYDKFRTIKKNDERIKALAEQIKTNQPDLVWYGDSSILSMQLSIMLQKDVKQVLSLHDAGTYHPSNKLTLKEKVQQKYTNHLLRQSLKALDKVQLLSESCEKTFTSLYPRFADKSIVMSLGATMPKAEAVKPEEIKEEAFYLFFGRIDKYKGISRICKAYCKLEGEKPLLILAGKGTYTEEERECIKGDSRIMTLNRYISDEEMLWLLEHAICVTLPYIEATQSGVLPVAFAYGKPAITSNEEGLTQFMEQGKTGYICATEEEYVHALEQMMHKDISGEMGKNAYRYYEEHLDWKRNVETFLNRMQQVNK